MSSYNKVIIMGNLTRDLEMRYTPKGTAVAQASIAINRKWRNEAGEDKEEVSFIDFKVWGRTAETMAQYLRKGYAVHVEGRLVQERWDDKQTGQARSKVLVLVETFQFLNNKDKDGGADNDGSAEDNQRGGYGASSRPASSGGYKKPAPSDNDGPPPEDDDVPF